MRLRGARSPLHFLFTILLECTKGGQREQHKVSSAPQLVPCSQANVVIPLKFLIPSCPRSPVTLPACKHFKPSLNAFAPFTPPRAPLPARFMMHISCIVPLTHPSINLSTPPYVSPTQPSVKDHFHKKTHIHWFVWPKAHTHSLSLSLHTPQERPVCTSFLLRDLLHDQCVSPRPNQTY